MKSLIKNSLGMWSATIVAAILIVFSAIGLAQASDQSTDNVIKVKNVKELLDNIVRYNGKKIQVSGKVDKILDDHSFILESGGIFNNEIVVIVPKNNIKVKENESPVTVTGTLSTADLIETETYYGQKLNPELSIEKDEVAAYIVADSVEEQQYIDDNPNTFVNPNIED
jgi:hypothetical protein